MTPNDNPENNFSLKSIGDKLKSARQTQHKSLDDIAELTKINKTFLLEIENGIKSKLPDIYIRAFVRDYASVVGIPLSELFEEEMSSHVMTSPNSKFEFSSDSLETERKNKKQTALIMIYIAIIGICLIVLFILLNKDQKKDVKEISFSDVIKEQESRMESRTTIQDSVKSGIEIYEQVPDTLILEGVAIESVWVSIGIDGIRTNEYVFPPFYRKQWKSKNYFLISLGNGAAISFSLNGVKLGTLSPLKRPIKNLRIDWETYKKLKR